MGSRVAPVIVIARLRISSTRAVCGFMRFILGQAGLHRGELSELVAQQHHVLSEMRALHQANPRAVDMGVGIQQARPPVAVTVGERVLGQIEVGLDPLYLGSGYIDSRGGEVLRDSAHITLVSANPF